MTVARRSTLTARVGRLSKKATWYLRRASRMSAPEVMHRIVEQVHHAVDARRPGSWDGFGNFETEFRPIPDFDALARVPGLEQAVTERNNIVRRAAFDFLNQSWPVDPQARIRWLLDPVNGGVWPGKGIPAWRTAYRHEHAKGDVKFVWELNRLQFLQPLAIGGGAASAGEIASILHGWMNENPPYDGINWTNGIEAASRIVSLLVAMSATEGALAAQEGATIRAFIEAHLQIIVRYPSRFSSANNHRVAELAAILIATYCMPGLPRAAMLGKAARTELDTQIFAQFHADGTGAEQSPTYGAYSLEWFALAGIVANHAGVPFSDGYKERAAAAATALMWLFDDAGVVPEIGDNDAGRVLSVGGTPEARYCASVVDMVGRWLDRADLRAPRTDPAIRDLMCQSASATDRTASPCPLEGARTFAEGGWTIFRERMGAGTLVLAFDHAPLGFLSIAAHGHADALSVVLSVGTDPVLIDPGTYLYHGGHDLRDLFRSTRVHNTLEIEGQDQSIMAGPFNWTRHAKTRLTSADATHAEASHDGYRSRLGLVHARRVTHDGPGRFTIVDRVTSNGPARPFSWIAGYALHPDVSLVVTGNVAMLTAPRSNARIRLTASQNWDVSDMTVSPGFNLRVATRRLELRGTAAPGDTVARVGVDVASPGSSH